MKQGIFTEFDNQLTSQERLLLDGLHTPADIQSLLDSIPYAAGERNRSPLEILRERQAHCLDGALLAAAMLRRQGYPPLIVDLQPEPGQDDDHVLALFKIEGYWGAVAQSNYTGLRYREAIHRTMRELVLTYFENFYNPYARKTLRYYSRPIDLSRFDRFGWMWSSVGVDAVEKYLKQVHLTPLLTPAQESRLIDVEQLSFQAGRLGLNEQGVFFPKTNKGNRQS